jgi:putative transposase
VFVTTTVQGWLPIFTLDHLAEDLAHQLSETSQTHGVKIMGYVVMPSHIHLFLGLDDYASLPRFMQDFKSLSSRRIRCLDLGNFHRQLTKDGRFSLWMRRFDDVILYSDKQFRRKLEYIHNNPVRAGLVNVATEWKYSSARDWLEGVPGLIPLEKSFPWT